jgi:hypothetical protein
MRFALLDNSTLTGIQRLLGEIPVKNKLIVDSDILCFESLLQSILFYDKILFVDDYKPEHSITRKQYFSYLIPVSKAEIDYETLVFETQKLSRDIIPRVESGEFTDRDFKPFFDLLRMNVIFTWDEASSIFFLTQKMLERESGVDIEKYSKLSTAIYSELTEKTRTTSSYIEERAELYDSRGVLIDENYSKEGRHSSEFVIPKQVKAFFAGLSWLAYRTIFYSLISKNTGVDLFLHPIRQSFQINFLSKIALQYSSIFKSLIETINNVSKTTANRIIERTQPSITTQQLPLFVAWFATKSNNPIDFIEIAHSLRSEHIFVETRRLFSELEELKVSDIRGEFLKQSNKILGEIESLMEKLNSKYYVNTNQGFSISKIIKLWNFATKYVPVPAMPEIDFRIKELEFIKHLIPEKGINAVYKNLVEDLTKVSRLGNLHEIISSKLQLDEYAGDYYSKYVKRR